MWRQTVLSVALPLVLITFAAGLTALASTRLTYHGEYPDPFAPYETVMPGAGRTEFVCDSSITYGSGQASDCEIRPNDGFFVSITSTTYHNRIIQTSFMAHDLSVGDIIQHWGRPDIVVKFNRTFSVFWEAHGLIGIIDPVGPPGQFSYMLRVEQFTISVQRDNRP